MAAQKKWAWCVPLSLTSNSVGNKKSDRYFPLAYKGLILQNWLWKMTFGASCSRNMKTRWLPYHVTLGMLTGSVHVYTRLWRIAEYVSCLVLGKPRSAWWTGGMLYIYLLQHKASWRLLHNFIWSGLPVVCYSEYCSVWTQCLEVCFQCDATLVSVDICYVPAPNLFHCIVLAPEFLCSHRQLHSTIFSMLLIIYWPVYVFWLRSLRQLGPFKIWVIAFAAVVCGNSLCGLKLDLHRLHRFIWAEVWDCACFR